MPVIELKECLGVLVDLCGSNAAMCSCIDIEITFDQITDFQNTVHDVDPENSKQIYVSFCSQSFACSRGHFSVTKVLFFSEPLGPFDMLEGEQQRRVLGYGGWAAVVDGRHWLIIAFWGQFDSLKAPNSIGCPKSYTYGRSKSRMKDCCRLANSSC